MHHATEPLVFGYNIPKKSTWRWTRCDRSNSCPIQTMIADTTEVVRVTTSRCVLRVRVCARSVRRPGHSRICVAIFFKDTVVPHLLFGSDVHQALSFPYPSRVLPSGPTLHFRPVLHNAERDDPSQLIDVTAVELHREAFVVLTRRNGVMLSKGATNVCTNGKLSKWVEKSTALVRPQLDHCMSSYRSPSSGCAKTRYRAADVVREPIASKTW
jgi:hypothetical protein